MSVFSRHFPIFTQLRIVILDELSSVGMLVQCKSCRVLRAMTLKDYEKEVNSRRFEKILEPSAFLHDIYE